jgi:hypothetical protein
LISDSCQLVQEIQHERSIKESSQKGENIRKSLNQNIGIGKSYSGKQNIPIFSIIAFPFSMQYFIFDNEVI